jgi:hypothetical protein
MDEKSDLEKKFEQAYSEGKRLIEEHLKKASEELNKAIQVSETLGVPFYSGISFIGNTYTPRSFSKIWDELDEDFLYDYEASSYPGWEHSAVC